MISTDLDAEIEKKQKQLQTLMKAKENPAIYQLYKDNIILKEQIENLKKKQPIFGSCNTWSPYPGGGGALVQVNYSHLHFTKTPQIFTSLHGTSHIWVTTGATSIYSATKDGFTVYVKGMTKEEIAQYNVVLRYVLFRAD